MPESAAEDGEQLFSRVHNSMRGTAVGPDEQRLRLSGGIAELLHGDTPASLFDTLAFWCRGSCWPAGDVELLRWYVFLAQFGVHLGSVLAVRAAGRRGVRRCERLGRLTFGAGGAQPVPLIMSGPAPNRPALGGAHAPSRRRCCSRPGTSRPPRGVRRRSAGLVRPRAGRRGQARQRDPAAGRRAALDDSLVAWPPVEDLPFAVGLLLVGGAWRMPLVPQSSSTGGPHWPAQPAPRVTFAVRAAD